MAAIDIYKLFGHLSCEDRDKVTWMSGVLSLSSLPNQTPPSTQQFQTFNSSLVSPKIITFHHILALRQASCVQTNVL